MLKNNIVFKTDSYKLTHWSIYNELEIRKIFSYFEARDKALFPTTTFFGLQILLKILEKNPITQSMIDEGELITNTHIGPNLFNRDGWEHILKNHNGRLPVIIKAVPEGTEVPKGNVLLTIENTDPLCNFLPNHLETFLTQVWYPSTVATLSKEIKKACIKYLELTSSCPDAINFMLHDFGERGVSSMDSAGIGGLGHLVNFYGTDTVEALLYAKNYYHEDMAGFSVIATEHSIMTSRGKEGEFSVIDAIVKKYKDGILSLVLDSYDIYSAVNYLTTDILDLIKARIGKVVIRPDSGEPIIVLEKIFNILENNLKSEITINSKGYKVLPPYIGVIWGDGLDIDKIYEILEFLKVSGWSVDNIVFGMGGGLLQKVNRDTQAFAFKCSANMIKNDEWNDVWKDPIDSSSGKKSKKGCLKLIKDSNGNYKTVRIDDPEYLQFDNELKVVFENGFITKEFTLKEVRTNASL
jgi:nicotinamide phosphoribosyltransferase